MDTCVICNEEGVGLVHCKDAESWTRLHRAAVIRQHQTILALSTGESEFPESPVKYHVSCRKAFVNQKTLQSMTRETVQSSESSDQRRGSIRNKQASSSSKSAVLPDVCLFCKKDKYKSGTKTREKLRGVQEFRADNRIRESALQHIKRHTNMSSVAAEIYSICSKDLISSEARYHSSCYNSFVRVIYEPDATSESSANTTENKNGIDKAYNAVYSFCENFIANPRVIEFKEIRKVLADEAERIGVTVTESHYKNLLRMVSNKFQELEFINYQQNKVLVYPITLETANLAVENYALKTELNALLNQTSLDDDTKAMINAAKILNKKIKAHPIQMPWPPEEKDLNANKVSDYIPELLDTFCTILMSGQSMDADKSKSERTVRLKNSLAQDIVYSVSNGAIKTPKSVLLPAVIKALCNNTEVVKLVNKCGHGIGYNLIEEIDTEFALRVINEQTLSRVLIP